MVRGRVGAGLWLSVALCASSAVAQPAAVLRNPADNPFTSAPAPAAVYPPYLTPALTPDASLFLPPAPQPGSPVQAADVAAFRRTRALEGSARWRMAASDAELAPSALMADFACALGVKLDPTTAPTLARLIQRMGRDAGGAAHRAKEIYSRPRPFLTNSGPICLPKSPDLVQSWSYPSGHSTYSWSVGLVLAEIAPDRAAAILGRAKAYGESRVVCGVHYVSDVEQGRTTASGVVAALHADPTFLTDLGLARAEVMAARGRGPAPAPAQCRIEAETIAQTPPLGTR